MKRLENDTFQPNVEFPAPTDYIPPELEGTQLPVNENRIIKSWFDLMKLQNRPNQL